MGEYYLTACRGWSLLDIDTQFFNSHPLGLGQARKFCLTFFTGNIGVLWRDIHCYKVPSLSNSRTTGCSPRLPSKESRNNHNPNWVVFISYFYYYRSHVLLASVSRFCSQYFLNPFLIFLS